MAKVEEKFPGLRKTLQEIREMDPAPPRDLFPNQDLLDKSEIECSTTSTGGFSWRRSNSALDAHLESRSKGSTQPKKQLEKGTDHKDRSSKRKRERGASLSRKKRIKKAHSNETDERVSGQKTSHKPRRRMVMVSMEKVKPLISPLLFKFYRTVLRAAMVSDDKQHIKAIQILLTKISQLLTGASFDEEGDDTSQC